MNSTHQEVNKIEMNIVSVPADMNRPSEDRSDEQLETLTPWSKEVQNVCKN